MADDTTTDGTETEPPATPAAPVKAKAKTKPAAGAAVADENRLRELVREIVAEALDDDEGGGETETATPPAGPQSAAQQERTAEDEVRKAMGKIKSEEDTQSRIKKLEEKVVEAPPQVFRRLTRMMWGSGDKR